MRLATSTGVLRVLLGGLTLCLLLSAGALWLVSLESADNWPTLAHLRVQIYCGSVVGMLPAAALIALAFRFLSAVDDDEAFSARTLAILGRAKAVCALAAVYYLFGLVAFWVSTGLWQPSMLFGWLVLEIAVVLLAVGFAMLERLVTAAVEWRQDSEATV